jgi:hypothetical protein
MGEAYLAAKSGMLNCQWHHFCNGDNMNMAAAQTLSRMRKIFACFAAARLRAL